MDLLTGDSGTKDERRDRIDEYHLSLLLRFVLKRDSNCLDAGAYVGLFLAEMLRMAPQGSHIAYEPLPHVCAELRDRFPGVDIRQRALSNEEGESSFVQVLDPGNNNNLSPGFLASVEQKRFLVGDSELPTQERSPEVKTQTLMVTTERLDEHVPEGWLPDFVKIDVDGAELLLLEGAMDTLRRAKPTIAIEHGWNLEDLGVSNEIYKLLCDGIGLRLFDMDGNGPLDRPEFLDGLNSGWNWIAHE